MRESLGSLPAPSNSDTADFRSKNIQREKRRNLFSVIAEHVYPDKTVPNVRALTGKRYGERTIYDWLAGNSAAPFDVMLKLLVEADRRNQ